MRDFATAEGLGRDRPRGGEPMKIPVGPSGFPTLSPTQLRAYGAGGFTLSEQELPQGCPRQYKARYVERRVPEQSSYELDHGRYVHKALHLMEEQGLTPDEALVAALPHGVTPEGFAEARADIEAYLERGASPSDRFGTLGTELELDAELYVDEEFGPVRIRAILDHIAADTDYPNVLHCTDFKTNRRPATTAEVRGDVQLKTQHYVAAEWARSIGMPSPRVVMHLDLVKFRDVEVVFSEADIAAWRDWAEAVARAILRDETAEPVLNPHCDRCPVRGDCPAYADLPSTAERVLTGLAGIEDDAELLRWRDSANRFRLLLEKAVDGIDARFKERALAAGVLEVGGAEFVRDTDWATEVDLPGLHTVMQGAFYDVISTSRTKVTERTADWAVSDRAAALACFNRVPVGHAVTRRKATREAHQT